MPDLVRVKLPDGAEASVGRSFAKSRNLKVLDKPATQYGRAIPTKTKAQLAGGTADEGGPFDPAADGVGVDDVNTYLAGADADEVARVLQLEADGKNRKGIVEGPHSGTSGDPDPDGAADGGTPEEDK